MGTNFSALINAKNLMYGAGLVGTSAAGTAGWQAIDGSVGGQRRYSFVANPLGGFENGTNTSAINANNDKNVLGLKRGKCFSKFFPGSSVINPPDYTKDPKNTPSIPHMDLSDNPIGCATIKLSRPKDKRHFVYKSEFTIKTVSDGLSLSVGVTNMKDNGHLYFEFWITFLKRGHWNWYEVGHERWAINPKTPTFNTRVFINANSAVTLTAQALQTGEDKNLTGPLQWEHQTFAGFWTMPTEGKKVAFIEEGSTEKWGLKDRYKVMEKDAKGVDRVKAGVSALLNNTKLTQQGKWTTPKEYCAKVQSDSNKFPLSAPKRDRDICYVSE